MRMPRRFRSTRTTAAALGAALAALTLTACGTSPDSDGEIRVVASTNVWGSVAQAVAGDRLEVTSIVTEPSADPHSYEASRPTPRRSPTRPWWSSTAAVTTSSSRTS